MGNDPAHRQEIGQETGATRNPIMDEPDTLQQCRRQINSRNAPPRSDVIIAQQPDASQELPKPARPSSDAENRRPPTVLATPPRRPVPARTPDRQAAAPPENTVRPQKRRRGHAPEQRRRVAELEAFTSPG